MILALNFSLTKEDLYNYNYYTTWEAPEKKKFRIIYYLKIVGFVLLFGLLVLKFDNKLNATGLLLACLVSAAIGIGFGHLNVKKQIKRNVERFYSKEVNSNFLSKKQMVITEEAIKEKDAVSETNYSWNAIIRKVEVDHYYYLYISSLQALVVPKRILSLAEMQDLEYLMAKKLSIGAELTNEI